MQPSNFVNIDNINKSTRFSVFGYIRDCQSLFDTDNPYYNIPDLVCFICIAYLAEIEYFTVVSKNVRLEDSDTRITKTVSEGYDAAYGNIDVDIENDNCIHLWTFKVLHTNDYGNIVNFGIDYSNKQYTEFYVGKHDEQIGIGDECFEYGGDYETEMNEYGRIHGMCTGDVITMELNCNDHSLNYTVENDRDDIKGRDGDLKFGFHGVIGGNRKYNMVVSMGYEDDSVQLLEYQRISLKK